MAGEETNVLLFHCYEKMQGLLSYRSKPNQKLKQLLELEEVSPILIFLQKKKMQTETIFLFAFWEKYC